MDRQEALLEERLAAYVRAQMPEATDVVVANLGRQAMGNSRENWIFDAVWTLGGRREVKKLVLRRNASEPVLATDEGNEFRVLKALEGHVPFPTPKAYWLDQTGWLDRPFMIIEFYPGKNDRNIINDPTLSLDTRLRLARHYTEMMAQLHNLDWNAAGLSFLGAPKPGRGAAEAELEKWMCLAGERTEPEPIVVEAYYWLRRHMPENTRVSLVHGDFRPGNSLVLDGEVTVMLDWENALLGDPMLDLGWYTMPNYYDREHFLPGVYHHKEFYDYYGELTGRRVDEDLVYYYRVMTAFRFVAHGIHSIRHAKAESRSLMSVGPRYIGMRHLLAKLIGL